MRRRSFACVLGALGCVSPALRAQQGSVGDTQGDRVPAWSIGAGTGIVAIPVTRVGAFGVAGGFVSVEPRLAPNLVLHGELGGGHSTVWLDAPEAQTQAYGRVGMGVRGFFVREGPVRPSLLLQGTAQAGRFSDERGNELSFEHFGGELAVAADASISTPVSLRLEAAVVSFGRLLTHEGELDQFIWEFRAGIAPRAEVRFGW